MIRDFFTECFDTAPLWYWITFGTAWLALFFAWLFLVAL